MTKLTSAQRLFVLVACALFVIGLATTNVLGEPNIEDHATHQHDEIEKGDQEESPNAFDGDHDKKGKEHNNDKNSSHSPSRDEQDDHGHDEEVGHDEDEEGGTKISPASALRMGVVVERAGPAMIAETVSLTGRITLDQNRKADVRARFAGIVRSVNVELGETVKKGQLLAVVEANESLRDFRVVAPIDGVVLSRNTNVGDVTGGDPLFKIADLSEVWAKFHIFPRDAERIAAGQSVTIHTLERDKMAAAKITMLFPTADALSQTLIAIVPLANQNGVWKPGMTIEGDVAVSSRRVDVAVRRSGIQKMEELGNVVFLADGQRFAPRPIKLGIQGDEFVEVVEGLASGETYVADGSFIVKSDILKATAAHSH
ncbi:MAG: efflux RND transporter periplasmic adaptor subunit [Alphaproteobacteria bacterium]